MILGVGVQGGAQLFNTQLIKKFHAFAETRHITMLAHHR